MPVVELDLKVRVDTELLDKQIEAVMNRVNEGGADEELLRGVEEHLSWLGYHARRSR